MVEEIVTPEVVVKVDYSTMTEEQLTTALAAAVNPKKLDLKSMKLIAVELAKRQAATEAKEREAKNAVLVTLAAKVQTEIDSIVNAYKASGEFDSELVQGVFYTFDFGNTASGISLSKKATVRTAKATTGEKSPSTGAAKKFDVKTEDLLAGNSWISPLNQAVITEVKAIFESTTDGNKRYNGRIKLLKAAGYIA
jgi:hypothetical protein